MWKPYPTLSKDEWGEFERAFRKKSRFLVDEIMGRDVAVLLQGFGYNATFVGDVGLSGHSDEDVFAYAWKHKRILLTHDSDFLDDARFPFHRNYGVIVLPGAEGDGTLEKSLSDLLRLTAPYERAHVGAKIDVTQDRVWTIRGFIKQEGRHVDRRIRLEVGGDVSEWEGSR